MLLCYFACWTPLPMIVLVALQCCLEDDRFGCSVIVDVALNFSLFVIINKYFLMFLCILTFYNTTACTFYSQTALWSSVHLKLQRFKSYRKELHLFLLTRPFLVFAALQCHPDPCFYHIVSSHGRESAEVFADGRRSYILAEICDDDLTLYCCNILQILTGNNFSQLITSMSATLSENKKRGMSRTPRVYKTRD